MTFKRLALLFIVCFLLFTLVKLPFSILKPSNSDTMFKGTVWKGYTENVSTAFGSASIRFHANPLSLAALSLSGEWSLSSRAIEARGDAAISVFSNPVFSDSFVDVNIAALNPLEPIIGTLSMSINRLELTKEGACISVDGNAYTDALIRSQDSLKWRGPSLEGPLECIDNNFIINLKGEENGDQVSVVNILYPSGIYSNTITIKSENPILSLALVYQGFEKNGAKYTLQKNGKWQ
jgi:hypothetical protein